MRQQYVECSTEQEARGACPWAAIVVEVEGGYLAFESAYDYYVWQDQD